MRWVRAGRSLGGKYQNGYVPAEKKYRDVYFIWERVGEFATTYRIYRRDHLIGCAADRKAAMQAVEHILEGERK